MGKERIKITKKKSYTRIGDEQFVPKRSSRRRKKNSNTLSADDHKLRQAVEGDGSRTIIDIDADGNCLFRAISDQLYHDFGNNHAEVRDEICNFLAGHKDDFSFFLVLDDEDAAENEEDASDFETYVANMREDGDWGGHLELVAAARMYRRNITVYSSYLEAFTIEHGSDQKDAGPDLLLSYHDNDHYNSVRTCSTSKPPPPIKTHIAPLISPKQQEPQGSEGNGTEMVLEETTSTTNTSAGSSESLPDVEMSDKVAPPPSKLSKKNAPCPCGSKLRYKKCCAAKEKHASRVKTLRQATESNTVSNTASGSDEPTMDGNFRVLRI